MHSIFSSLRFLSFFFKFLIFIYVYMCEYMHMSIGTSRGHRPYPLELELQAVVSHLMLVLRTELRSSGRAVCGLNHRAIFPVLHLHFTAAHHFSSGVQCWCSESFRVWSRSDFCDDVCVYVHVVCICVFLRKPSRLVVILISVYVTIV